MGFRGQMNQLVDVLANGGLLNQLVRNWEGGARGLQIVEGKGKRGPTEREELVVDGALFHVFFPTGLTEVRLGRNACTAVGLRSRGYGRMEKQYTQLVDGGYMRGDDLVVNVTQGYYGRVGVKPVGQKAYRGRGMTGGRSWTG